MLMPYQPEPYVDFNQPGPRANMLEALALVKSQLGRTYPAYINGKSIDCPVNLPSVNPANPTEIIGQVGMCTADMAEDCDREIPAYGRRE